MRPSAGCGSTDGLLSSTVTSIAVVHPAAPMPRTTYAQRARLAPPICENAGARQAFPSMPVTRMTYLLKWRGGRVHQRVVGCTEVQENVTTTVDACLSSKWRYSPCSQLSHSPSSGEALHGVVMLRPRPSLRTSSRLIGATLGEVLADLGVALLTGIVVGGVVLVAAERLENGRTEQADRREETPLEPASERRICALSGAFPVRRIVLALQWSTPPRTAHGHAAAARVSVNEARVDEASLYLVNVAGADFEDAHLACADLYDADLDDGGSYSDRRWADVEKRRPQRGGPPEGDLRRHELRGGQRSVGPRATPLVPMRPICGPPIHGTPIRRPPIFRGWEASRSSSWRTQSTTESLQMTEAGQMLLPENLRNIELFVRHRCRKRTAVKTGPSAHRSATSSRRRGRGLGDTIAAARRSGRWPRPAGRAARWRPRASCTSAPSP